MLLTSPDLAKCLLQQLPHHSWAVLTGRGALCVRLTSRLNHAFNLLPGCVRLHDMGSSITELQPMPTLLCPLQVPSLKGQWKSLRGERTEGLWFPSKPRSISSSLILLASFSHPKEISPMCSPLQFTPLHPSLPKGL